MTVFREIMFVAIGGSLGAVGRYGANLWAYRLVGDSFPLGTLLVNVAGCFLLGSVMQAVLQMESHDNSWRHVLQHGVGVGFLGALTTFSTFGYETLRRLEAGQWSIAAASVGANFLVGMIAVWAGVALVKAMM